MKSAQAIQGEIRMVAIVRTAAVMLLSARAVQSQLPQTTPAQHAHSPAMTRDEITGYAKAHLAIAKIRDSVQLALGKPENNPDAPAKQLRALLRTRVADILAKNGMTDEEFRRKTFVLSSDDQTRAVFDTVVSQITGIPIPSKALPASSTAAVVKVPAGVVGMHIGHVVNSYRDTPAEQGLLSAAMAEARIAIQHAGLAAKAPTNLDAMKTHAGHVINAIDPSIIMTGPGLGYGVKKAALGVATHIELAAKSDGASPNVIGHSIHIATAARNTATRADSVIALARRIQAATSAADAAPLALQLQTLTQQLVSGFDANNDGKITWELGEGGLQQAQEHVNLMLAGEKIPPG
jgi:hypothetical protein